jgi:hypothetical protein
MRRHPAYGLVTIQICPVAVSTIMVPVGEDDRQALI